MKRISLLCVVLAILAAWANKPLKPSKFGLHQYSYRFRSYDGSRWYFSNDLTSQGWIPGWDFDCYYSQSVCTFMADPGNMHSDGTGYYFYSWNIPGAGIDYSGDFVSNH
ncbi:MAG TPA: hypothetical protein VI233_00245 [Puia sp.]